VPWSKPQAEWFLLASGKLRNTFWKIDRSAELLDERRRSFVDGLRHFLDLYVKHFVVKVEQDVVGSLLDWKNEPSCVLLEFTG
jgi:hypothetical protein